MKSPFHGGASLLLVAALLLAPSSALFAQQVKTATQPTATSALPEITLDNLLAADDYAVYGEVRALGRQLAAGDLAQLIEAVRMPGLGAPQELGALVDFVHAHAEALADTRVIFAALPGRAGLPAALVAAELPTAEQAESIIPQLRTLFPAPTAKPTNEKASVTTTTNSATLERGRTRRRNSGARLVTKSAASEAAAVTPEAALPAFTIKRSGRIIGISDQPFTLRGLRQPNTAPLMDEPGLQAARARFASETLFVYVNTARAQRNERQQREQTERQVATQQTATTKQQTNAGNGATASMNANSSASVSVGGGTAPTLVVRGTAPTKTVAVPNSNPSGVVVNDDEALLTTTELVAPVPVSGRVTNDPNAGENAIEKKTETPEELAVRQKQEADQRVFSSLMSVAFGGLGGGLTAGGSLPESIGFGAGFEGDALVVRAMFVRDVADERPPRPIPFLPIVLSGPSIASEAASILPADTDILANASLDLPQMYDYVASALKLADLAGGNNARDPKGGGFSSQLSTFERQHGFRIREELLSALGNEIAISLPPQYFGVARPRAKSNAAASSSAPASSPSPLGVEKAAEEVPAQTAPVFLVALRDKAALRALLPKVVAALGLTGATEQNLIERRGDVELLTYSQGTLAFIDNFLVVAPDALTMRWLTDAYNRRDTLAASAAYRAASGWQPRQTLGQVYVSAALIQSLLSDTQKSIDDIDDEVIRSFLARLDFNAGAITYNLVREGNGLVHELHLPKSLPQLFVAASLVGTKTGPLRANEASAQWKLRNLQELENEYKEKHDRYATLEELEAFNHERTKEVVDSLRNDDDKDEANEEANDYMFDFTGYDLKLNASGATFSAAATPTDYRKTGRRSFYIDQTGILRGGDLNGRTATDADETINN